MVSECLVCGRSDFEPHLEILSRCRACGFITARWEDPIDSGSLYSEDYFKGEEYLDYPSDEVFFKKNFGVRLREILARRGQVAHYWEETA